MLYEKLRNIYQKNPVLKHQYDFEKYYTLLNQFLVSELRSNAKFINPYRFSYDNGLPIDEIIGFFLALSIDDGIFQVRHKLVCLECGNISILCQSDFDEDEVICESCGDEELTAKIIHQDNLSFLFVLREDIAKEIREKMSKKTPSSNEYGDMEEGGVKGSKIKELVRQNPDLYSELLDQAASFRELVLGGV